MAREAWPYTVQLYNLGYDKFMLFEGIKLSSFKTLNQSDALKILYLGTSTC